MSLECSHSKCIGRCNKCCYCDYEFSHPACPAHASGVAVNEFGVPIDGFKVGDIVHAPQIGEGEVTKVWSSPAKEEGDIYVSERRRDGFVSAYHVDGKYRRDDAEPSLRLIERPAPPKKKTTKTIERWVTVYENGEVSLEWNDEHSARMGVPGWLTAAHFVKLTGTYEVEE